MRKVKHTKTKLAELMKSTMGCKDESQRIIPPEVRVLRKRNDGKGWTSDRRSNFGE